MCECSFQDMKKKTSQGISLDTILYFIMYPHSLYECMARCIQELNLQLGLCLCEAVFIGLVFGECYM